MNTTAPAYLFLQHRFNLSHFLLDFAGELFILAFGSQVGVVGNLPAFSLTVPFASCRLALISSFVLCFIWFLLIACDVMQVPARDSVRNRPAGVGSVTRLTSFRFGRVQARETTKTLDRSPLRAGSLTIGKNADTDISQNFHWTPEWMTDYPSFQSGIPMSKSRNFPGECLLTIAHFQEWLRARRAVEQSPVRLVQLLANVPQAQPTSKHTKPPDPVLQKWAEHVAI